MSRSSVDDPHRRSSPLLPALGCGLSFLLLGSGLALQHPQTRALLLESGEPGTNASAEPPSTPSADASAEPGPASHASAESPSTPSADASAEPSPASHASAERSPGSASHASAETPRGPPGDASAEPPPAPLNEGGEPPRWLAVGCWAVVDRLGDGVFEPAVVVGLATGQLAQAVTISGGYLEVPWSRLLTDVVQRGQRIGYEVEGGGPAEGIVEIRRGAAVRVRGPREVVWVGLGQVRVTFPPPTHRPRTGIRRPCEVEALATIPRAGGRVAGTVVVERDADPPTAEVVGLDGQRTEVARREVGLPPQWLDQVVEVRLPGAQEWVAARIREQHGAAVRIEPLGQVPPEWTPWTSLACVRQ